MGGNKSTYLGMKIGRVRDSDFEDIVPDSDNYDGGISHIEISHAMTRHRNGAITEETNNFAIGIGEIDADCAIGRDLRFAGRRANLFGGENDRYSERNRRLFIKCRKGRSPERKQE